MTLYRVTCDGVGIYEAFKKAVNCKTWCEFKQSEEVTWLPVPPNYTDRKDLKSYFKETGLEKFKDTALKKIAEVVKKEISIEAVTIANDKIVYEDEYQVVVSG